MHRACSHRQTARNATTTRSEAMSRGIDYSPVGSTVNRDPSTGIRYGIIPLGQLGEFAHESFENRYDPTCPHCGDDVPEDTHFTVDNRPVDKQYGFWTACPS